jgi:hypothetical protein
VSARLTAQDVALRSISEVEWQATVIEIAEWNGWKWYHSPKNRPVGGKIQNIIAGYPDLCLVRGRRLLFVELKRERGVTTVAQKEWLAALIRTGAEVEVWRPSDVDDVKRVLARPSAA